MIINTLIIFFLTLSLIQELFYIYFKREINYSDIYNFFTHFQETFESFFTLWNMFIIPFLAFSVAILILFFIKSKNLKYLILLLLFTLNFNLIIQSLNLSSSIINLPSEEETQLHIKRDTNTNIILIIGESMKYNDYVQNRLKKQNFYFSKIYTGAINTDIAIPLLLNTKTNQLKLTSKNKTNLFHLAKRNNYKTSFISIQTDRSLQYIKPYLQLTMIDNYKTYTKQNRKPKYDFNLLDDLKKIDFKEKNFIVLQQIGQHSPYIYHPHSNPSYNKSIDYSFKLYKKIHQYLQKTKQPFVMLYLSDHGEFSGEGGRWGHNTFEKTIYEVPFFITSNIPIPKQYKKIKSHYHVAQFLTYILGFYTKLNLSCEKHIINGTMMSREDGFIEIDN